MSTWPSDDELPFLHRLLKRSVDLNFIALLAKHVPSALTTVDSDGETAVEALLRYTPLTSIDEPFVERVRKINRHVALSRIATQRRSGCDSAGLSAILVELLSDAATLPTPLELSGLFDFYLDNGDDKVDLYGVCVASMKRAADAEEGSEAQKQLVTINGMLANFVLAEASRTYTTEEEAEEQEQEQEQDEGGESGGEDEEGEGEEKWDEDEDEEVRGGGEEEGGEAGGSPHLALPAPVLKKKRKRPVVLSFSDDEDEPRRRTPAPAYSCRTCGTPKAFPASRCRVCPVPASS